MADLFSTPAEHAFEHDEINEALAGPSTMGDATEEMGVEEAFEVEDTIRRIREGGYKTVSQALIAARCNRHAKSGVVGAHLVDWPSVP